ncbi:AsmA family protein [Pararhodonellum marinum]|uniref:AsmA family protein n=1 Tax=Pararhodonellum marinum TaxID=2755358 RepID=UPI00188F5FFE|nr:AsmA-like C-terminal region-containing protein [Pararhodonellum marinum]
MKRRTLIVLASIVLIPVLLFAGGVFLMYQNQDAITQKLISEMNEQLAGEVEIGESHISPFANFPYISVDLQRVRVFETKNKDFKPLFESDDIYLGFDVFNLLKGNYEVKKIKVSHGHLDIIRFVNGEINLMNALGENQTDVEDEEEMGVALNLNVIQLENILVNYADLAKFQNLKFHLGKLSASLQIQDGQIASKVLGDLVFDLETQGQKSFFSDKQVKLDLLMDYDENTGLLDIQRSQVQLEEALFGLSGDVKFLDIPELDLKLTGEKPDFNIFAAFAPAEVAEALKRYQNAGKVFFNGSIKGKAGSGETPSVAVEFGCENAYFLNTNMDKKVDDLRFTGFFTNGKERNLRTSELQLQNFYARPEEGIFQGRLVIQNFEDPYIKVNLNADLDLEFLGKFFEVEGLQGLKGQVILDMDFDELVDMTGDGTGVARLKEGVDSELKVRDLSFTLPDYPHPITQTFASAVMRDGRLVLDHLRFRVEDSDFEFSGEVNDFPAIFHGLKVPIHASLLAKSKKINLPQLLSYDSALMQATDEEIENFEIKLKFETQADQLTGFEYLPLGNFYIEDLYAKLKHYHHVFHDFHADLHIEANDIQLRDFTGEIDGSDFHFSGKLYNYPKWFQDVKKGDTRFEFDMVSNQLKINDLLTYKGENYLPEDYRNEALRDLNLNGRIDLHYDTTFRSADLYIDDLDGKLNVHPLKLENFKGRVHFEDDQLLVENFSGSMGESDFLVNLSHYLGDDPALKAKANSFSMVSNLLDLDALMNYEGPEEEKDHEAAFNIFEVPFTQMNFQAEIKALKYHQHVLRDFKAKGRITEDHYLYLDTLGLRVADGDLGINGYFNGSDPDNIYFHSTLKANQLDIDQLLIKFDNFGQDVLINDNLHGKVSGTITSKFLVHPDFTPILEKSEAQMNLRIYEGSLVNFAPMQAMSAYFKDRNLNRVRFDTLENTLNLKDGTLFIPTMTINSSLGFIEMSGKQGLDLKMDYFIRVPLGLVTQVGFRSLFGGKNQGEVDPDQEDAIVYRDGNRRVRFVNINMRGTPDDYDISLGKKN